MIQKDGPNTRAAAAKIITDGGVIAFRTDTFYGLGADPFNAKAVKAIRDLKGREDNKPILLLISAPDQVTRFIENQSETFKLVAKTHWPGPLTIVGVARPNLPAELTAAQGTIGLRLPNDEDVMTLVRKCGESLTATSANVSGKPPARSASEVQNYFPTGVDLIIDGGETMKTEASTVLDLSEDGSPRLVREGAVKRETLKELLPSLQ